MYLLCQPLKKPLYISILYFDFLFLLLFSPPLPRNNFLFLTIIFISSIGVLFALQFLFARYSCFFGRIQDKNFRCLTHLFLLKIETWESYLFVFVPCKTSRANLDVFICMHEQSHHTQHCNALCIHSCFPLTYMRNRNVASHLRISPEYSCLSIVSNGNTYLSFFEVINVSRQKQFFGKDIFASSNI